MIMNLKMIEEKIIYGWLHVTKNNIKVVLSAASDMHKKQEYVADAENGNRNDEVGHPGAEELDQLEEALAAARSQIPAGALGTQSLRARAVALEQELAGLRGKTESEFGNINDQLTKSKVGIDELARATNA